MISLLKRIFCVVLAILIPIALFPVSAFADSFSDSDTGYLLLTFITELYGNYNNVTWTNVTSNVGDVNGAISGATDYVIGLYEEYAQSASDPYTAAALAAALAAAGCLAVIYDSVTGQGYVSLYLDQYISSLDGYWDYACSDMGLFRDEDGFYYWDKDNNDDIVDIPVATVYEFPLLPIASNSVSSVQSNGIYLYTSGSGTFYTCYASSRSSDVFLASYNNGSSRSFVAFSPSSGSYCDYVYYNALSSVAINSSYSDFYYKAVTTVSSSYSFNPDIPVFNSLNDVLSAFSDRVARAFRIVAEPSVYIDQLNQTYDKILFPDVSSPDYSPQPVIIDTDLWWESDFPSVVPNPTPGVYYRITDASIYDSIMPDLMEQLANNQISVEAPSEFSQPEDPSDPSSPSEIVVPFLPVVLPDFNFSLSGIWYYVVRWVQSIGSWLSMMFTVWASLPYAMVVPVYATAVIVIVLGVYKRFFM